jgi:hypothetical protein
MTLLVTFDLSFNLVSNVTITSNESMPRLLLPLYKTCPSLLLPILSQLLLPLLL